MNPLGIAFIVMLALTGIGFVILILDKGLKKEKINQWALDLSFNHVTGNFARYKVFVAQCTVLTTKGLSLDAFWPHSKPQQPRKILVCQMLGGNEQFVSR